MRRIWPLVLAVACGAIVLGLGTAFITRRVEQQRELDAVAPSAPRTGALERSDDWQPTLGWQTVGVPLSAAVRMVGPEWQETGATRDGRVFAYRGVGRALYLSRIGPSETRLELVFTGCGTFAIAPPIVLDDRWLQFGISPVDAYLRQQFRDFDIRPCSASAFWLGSGDSKVISLVSTSPAEARLAREPSAVVGGEPVSLGPFLPAGTLTRTSGVAASSTLHWSSAEGNFGYTILADAQHDLQSMKSTACHALRPAWLAWSCP